MRRKGLFIVLEGIDNIGKTATRDMLVSRFQMEDIPVEGIEFPYKGFHNLRKISKDKNSTHYERLLAHALSHSMTYPIIDKHINEGKVVILDRYWYSNLAYAPTFAGIPYDYIRDLEGTKLQPITPDLVVYLHSDGIYPTFHDREKITSDKDDAFDSADTQLRSQLLRAYEQVVEREWEANGSLHFMTHNVDDFTTLKDSVLCLEGGIDELFKRKINKLQTQHRKGLIE